LRDQQVKDLEDSLGRCSEELIAVQAAKAAVEDRLKSCQTAASEKYADLHAENLFLCDVNDGLRLKINTLSKVNKNLERCLMKYKLLEASPLVDMMPPSSPLASAPLYERLVTSTPPATRSDTSDTIATPVNQRTLEEELAMFDASVSEGVRRSCGQTVEEERSSILMKQGSHETVLQTSIDVWGLQSQAGGTGMRKFQTVCGYCVNR
jgi:hypothetical protein